MNKLGVEILRAGALTIENVRYASGLPGNNKLDMDVVRDNPFLRKRVSGLLADEAEKFEPDVLVAIPSGGSWLAEDISGMLDIPYANLQKVPSKTGTKKFLYDTPIDMRVVLSAERLVVVEDVFHHFTSTLGALAVPGVIERANAVVGVWDRGRHPSREPLPIPHVSLVTETIPPMLNPQDDLYSYTQG